jgi:hypothetical protein
LALDNLLAESLAEHCLVRLSTQIFVKGDRIDYEYHPESDTHTAWFSRHGKSVRGLTAGEMVNHLVPYRDNSRAVQELIRWLCR